MAAAHAPGTPAAELDETYRIVSRRLIPFLIVCYIMAYIDRSNIGIAKLGFMDTLGFSEAVYGLAGGLFYLGYSLFEVPSNLWMKRIGARLTIARIMFLWSLFSAMTAFMLVPWHFYTLRFLLGVAEAGFFPGVLLYLSYWAPAARRARMTAQFMAAMALAGIIANPLGGVIMTSMEGVAGLHGWQWLFLIEGLPGCALAVVAFFYLTNKPSEAKWLTDRQKTLLAEDLEREAVVTGVQKHGRFVDAIKDPRFFSLAIMAAAMISGLAGLALWIPTIIRESGIKDMVTVGLLSALPYVFGVVAQQMIARSSDRRQERRWHAAAPALFGALSWLCLPLAQGNVVLSVMAVCGIGIGMFGATGPFWSLPATYLKGTAAAGGIAIITTCGAAAGFVSPIIVGWLIDHTGSMASAQIYFGSLLAFGATLLVVLAGAKPKPAA
ncbi:MFS transporter [Brevundimonas sp.]|uniref:MFS transporter n=1 Tax=Brevundimonas sp. TaxID=1871086 RepID=UPI0026146CB8|nr:MFS transporter [Brevundimonas sp.]